ncbi:hypothetical protein ACFY2T_13795 [Streptomyces sp. NPDC001260]|uniref:hypothetical protein n=1 Tax=Streptomyces sp. NPDC001260 TaxID=3364551 RepID=UPI0036A8BC10
MAVDQLPGRVREFANYLNGLLARLDQRSGWCAVFWQRDPDGMRACLDGREVPPWDVMEALLHDLAATFGPGVAAPEHERARALHAAALTAYDARPGGRDALSDRLDVMLREQRYAVERQAELSRLLASAATRQEVDALRLDLAWARDDHDRATARCAELRARMAETDRRAAGERVSAVRRGHLPEGAGYRVDATHPRDAAPSGDAWAGRGGGESAGTGIGAGRQAGADRPDTGRQAGPYRPDTGRQGGPYRSGAPAVRPNSAPRDAAAPASRTPDAPDTGSRTPFRGPDLREPYGPDAPGPASPAPAPSPFAPEASVFDTPASGASAPESPGSDASAPESHGSDAPAAESPGFEAPTPAPLTPAPPTTKQRKRRRGSARFAGMVEEVAPVVAPPVGAPDAAAAGPAATGGRTPRGARFAGAAEAPEPRSEPEAEPLDTAGPREVAEAVGRLVRLRAEGRSGDAHALLVEVAHWPAARFPLLAAALQGAGLGFDWATLLWEAASLPAERLVAAADALVAAGRAADGEQILRQGVVRPATEIGQAVLGLAAEGRRREVGALLDAYVRVRTPEEAARSVEPDPGTLVPLLLEAAHGVSDERHWDLVHALRVAGFTA